MKSIEFTDQELDFLRKQYLMELEEAENYVKSIKSVLVKLGSSKPKKVAEPVGKLPKKRGRKPKVVKEEVLVKPIEKARKPRKDKGKGRRKGIKLVKPAVESKVPVLKTDEKSKKTLVPKKKINKRKSYRRKGVYLTPLSKPLKKKTVAETPLPIETPPEKAKENLTS